MSIINSVGIGGKNNRIDVKLVQASLNLCTPYREGEIPLIIDGLAGRVTTEAIKAFQRAAVGIQNPSGRIEPRTV